MSDYSRWDPASWPDWLIDGLSIGSLVIGALTVTTGIVRLVGMA